MKAGTQAEGGRQKEPSVLHGTIAKQTEKGVKGRTQGRGREINEQEEGK